MLLTCQQAAKGFADKFAPGKTNDAQREKGTDFLRKMYEKITKYVASC